MKFDRETFFAVAPFAVWMAMLMVLPSNAQNYALRTVCSALMLLPFASRLRKCDVSPKAALRLAIWSLAAGMLVFFLWVWPESFSWYRKFCVISADKAVCGKSPFEPGVCGSALTAMRLIGSAFVIAPIEEIFYRSYLYRRLQSRDWQSVALSKFDLSAFLWSVALFSLGHDRIVVAIIAGVVYQFVAIRAGLCASIIAHVITNLVLGIWVIKTLSWSFW
jgi:CAAX prenyl protease-like protein